MLGNLCDRTLVTEVINSFQHPCCTAASLPPTRLFLREPHSQSHRPLMHLVLLLQLQCPKGAIHYELYVSGQSLLVPQEAGLGQQGNVPWGTSRVIQETGCGDPNAILHKFYKEEVLLSHEIKNGQDELTYLIVLAVYILSFHSWCCLLVCSIFLVSFFSLHQWELGRGSVIDCQKPEKSALKRTYTFMAFVTKFRNVQTRLITFIRTNSGKDKLLPEIDVLVYFCICPAFTQVTNMY